MFRLTENEWETVKRNSLSDSMPSQIVIASTDRRNKSAPPYAFTEHGAVMLASVLRSPSAVQMSVMVTRAFIAMRQALSSMLSYDLKIEQLSHKVDQLNAHVEEIQHNQNNINQLQSQFNNEVALQIEVINDALDQLREKKTEPDNPIGFRVQRQEWLCIISSPQASPSSFPPPYLHARCSSLLGGGGLRFRCGRRCTLLGKIFPIIQVFHPRRVR